MQQAGLCGAGRRVNPRLEAFRHEACLGRLGRGMVLGRVVEATVSVNYMLGFHQPIVFTCPICDGALASKGPVLRCPQGHSFDVAREGYVNLLRGKPRGDTREMARARRTFLEQGWYAPLSERLNALAASCLAEREAPPATHAPVVLDAGCGEGYYLGRLMDALTGERDGTADRGSELPRHGTGNRGTEESHFGLPASLGVPRTPAFVGTLPAQGTAGLKSQVWDCDGLVYVGIDISKDAVRMAARRYPRAAFAVGDVTRRLPVVTGVVGLLLDVFAPRNAGEFARVVAPGGTLLVVIPGPGHLAEPREALSLLGIEPEKEQHVIGLLADAFELVSAEGNEYTMRLDREALAALVAMTPNAWHRTAEEAAAVLASLGDATAATASFRILRFRRR